MGGNASSQSPAVPVEVAERHRALERGHLALHALDQLAAVDGPCRRSGSRRRSAAPSARSGRSGRRRCARRSPASSSTTPRRGSRWRGRRRSSRGCSACRRRRDRRARRPSRLQAGGDAGGLLAQLVPRPLPEVAQLRGVADRHAVARPVAEDVLRVGDLGAREPLGARHRRVGEHLLVAPLDVEELPDRAPEGLEVLGRPAPQRGVVVEARARARTRATACSGSWSRARATPPVAPREAPPAGQSSSWVPYPA